MSIRVFDFFSGCGGTSCGFESAGMEIVLGLDNDRDAAKTFQLNFPKSKFICDDIRALPTTALKPLIKKRLGKTLFCGCAPCQPFSNQNNNKKKRDERINLLNEFGRFVAFYKPDFVFVENVPGMQSVKQRKGPFKIFTALLDSLGYSYEYKVVAASNYGVPQKRERLVLLASRNFQVDFPKPTHGTGTDNPLYTTVKDWIDGLPVLQAGESDPADPDHRASVLSEINLARIKSTPEGGGRENWPINLWLECHKKYDGHTDVYGRLSWNKPASGLTTKCISYSNGRFGHPEQDRALSVREAACLQTFPRQYKFVGDLKSKARQIGNAVPPLFAQVFAESLIRQIENY